MTLRPGMPKSLPQIHFGDDCLDFSVDCCISTICHKSVHHKVLQINGQNTAVVSWLYIYIPHLAICLTLFTLNDILLLLKNVVETLR